MRYVIIRDDDTNALTPVECLERLYRPFLDRGLPVNLAVIPAVATNALTPDGTREGFLRASLARAAAELPSERPASANRPPPELRRLPAGTTASATTPAAPVRLFQQKGDDEEFVASDSTIPVGANQPLVGYLLDNPGFNIVQHGCHHDCFEFDRISAPEAARRLEQGTRFLVDAGLPRPETFVAPHDKLSRVAFREVAKRFHVVSTGWFEWRRLPFSWWPRYLVKKIRNSPHWRVGATTLLSHPGCLLSCHRSYGSMVDQVIGTIKSRRLTVLVTHWWEYFRDGRPDEMFIHCLHQVAACLADQPDIRVIAFSNLVSGTVPG